MKLNSIRIQDSSQLSQFRFEVAAWKRLLEFLRNENAMLQDRLVEILNDDFNEQMLERAEDFQDDFRAQDFMLGFLLEDVRMQERELDSADKFDGLRLPVREQNRIRADVVKAEYLFSRLREAFSSFQVEEISTP